MSYWPKGPGRLLDAVDRLLPGSVQRSRAELGLLWFGLFRWKRRDSDMPATAIAFPCTATTTEGPTCWLMAFCLIAEAPLLHVLFAHVWNTTAAWASTGLHVLPGIYLIGHAKSIALRPTLLFPDRIEIRLGIIARRIVPLSDIERLAPCTGKASMRPDEQRLFGLDEPNLRLSAAGAHILFRVDEPGRLAAALAPS